MPLNHGFVPKVVQKVVFQKGPKMDPSKKSDFATNFFRILPVGQKSHFLATFFTFCTFSKNDPFFDKIIRFTCAKKVVKSGKKGSFLAHFGHFWEVPSKPVIFVKTQARGYKIFQKVVQKWSKTPKKQCFSTFWPTF